METPEEKLQRQARVARVSPEEKLQNIPQNYGALVIGFNADLGQDIIQLLDGSRSYASSDTNGAKGVGDRVLLHQGRGIAHVDSLWSVKKSRKERQPLPQYVTYSFWLLLEQYLFSIKVQGSKATIGIITRITDFPFPYDAWTGSEQGFTRISNTEFYLPFYTSIDKYNINEHTASSIYGIRGSNGADRNSPIRYIYSNCSLPSNHFYFAVELRASSGNESYAIYHIYPDGSSQIHRYYTGLRSDSNTGYPEAWSIAATTENILYMVLEYSQLVRYEISTGTLETIFHNFYQTNITSRYGNSPYGYPIEEIDYVFSDPTEKCIYCTALIRDSGIEGLQLEYNVEVTIIGTDEEVESGKIVRGDFPLGVVCPSDRILDAGIGSAFIYKVIDDNTVCVYTQGWTGTARARLETRARHYRTAIFKINETGEMSLYYKFPGVDNRQSADGYRDFYNLPCRGATIDSKTKDIYITGSRSYVVENGKYIGNREGFDDGSIVKITGKEKKLVTLKLSFDGKINDLEKKNIKDGWYGSGIRVEPIYKF